MIVHYRMNKTTRAFAAALLIGAALTASVPTATAGIIDGIALLGSNTNNNADSSINTNTVAGGSQQQSGNGVSVAKVSTVGDIANVFSTNG